MIDVWQDDPHDRLRASKAISGLTEDNLRQEFSIDASPKPWPFGMPTSINPSVVVLGASPGNSPDPLTVGTSSSEARSYSLPTLGAPHPGLFYADNRKFFVKIRLLICGIMENLYGISDEKDALSLGGLMNLDTGEYGNAVDVPYNDELVSWVLRKSTEEMKPRFLICLGLWGERRRVLTGIDKSLNSYSPDAAFPFLSGALSEYNFRVWVLKNEGRKPTFIVFWPNHPSRPPFTNDELWKKSIADFALYMKTHFSDSL